MHLDSSISCAQGDEFIEFAFGGAFEFAIRREDAPELAPEREP
jgi:hypothetical protein